MFGEGTLLKSCTACRLPKPSTQFYKDRRASDGLHSCCKPCHLKRTGRYKRTDKGRHIERASRMKHYRLHREKDIAITRRWQERHPEKVRETNRRRQGTAKRIASNRAFFQRNPHVIEVYSSRRRSLKIKAAGHHTREQWLARVEVYGWLCWMCQKPLIKKTLTQDHVMPLSKGGSNWSSNLRPACKSCNSRKHDRKHYAHARAVT